MKTLTLGLFDGRRCVVLPDERGHQHYYAVVRLKTEGEPGVALARLLCKVGTARRYQVVLTTNGHWLCTCPHHVYRGPGEGCKHVQAVRLLTTFEQDVEVAVAEAARSLPAAQPERRWYDDTDPQQALAEVMGDDDLDTP